MQEHIIEFVDKLKSKFGNNLISVILYGSAAREDRSESSDTNMMVVLKELSLSDLSSAKELIQKARKKHQINSIFWSESELKNSSDVFPVEFTEIANHHKILHGTDPFSGLTIERKNIQHQVEFELRSKQLKLRGEWLNLQGSKADLTDFLGKAGTSFLHLIPFAQEVAGGKIPENFSDSFKTCVKLKKNEIKLNAEELEKLYQAVHDGIGRVISIINNA